MKNKSRINKQDVVEVDDIEFDLEHDSEFSRYSESGKKAIRRRQTKRRLDRLKEKKWFKENSWYEDDYLYDVE